MIKNNDKEKSKNGEQKTQKCQLIFGGWGCWEVGFLFGVYFI